MRSAVVRERRSGGPCQKGQIQHVLGGLGGGKFCLVLIVVGSVLGLRAEAGSRPAANYFLLFCQKKVTKEKATLLPASLLWCSPAGCAAELTARLCRSV